MTLSSMFLSLLALAGNGENEADSVRSVMLQEVSVVSSPKENGSLRQQPASVSIIGKQQLEDARITSLKGVSTLVPNFFMPDYGSRLTSAVYIRGIGSRIGTPAVGLYVDNVPYYDKTAFDFRFNDVERVDVLRGPQSTMYGRNTMGGLVKVHTKSPFLYEGTDVSLGFATKNSERSVALTHYHRISDTFAFSAGGFYVGNDGFFYNDNAANGRHKVDDQQSAGGRIRGIYKPSERVMLDMNASYEYSDEGAYPYFYTGTVNGEEPYADMIGKITNNIDGNYRRGLFNAGVNAEIRGDKWVFNSVTGFQNINDRMLMDQDFIAADIYTLEQKQKLNTLSEELTLKSLNNNKWQWIFGASAFGQWARTKAPVTFRTDGVQWLNSMINTNANHFMPEVAAGPMTMKFNFADNILGDELAFNNDFKSPMMSSALFHQSTFGDLFGCDGLSATLGIRFGYEKMRLDYGAGYDFVHNYSLSGHLKMPMMERDITMVPAADYAIANQLCGELVEDYCQLMPRVALKYDFSQGNIYASASRGFRSGGYNMQGISELLRSMMTTDMMADVADVTIPVLEEQKAVPQDTKETIIGVLKRMSQGSEINVGEACFYKPEYAWNYEVGTHLNLFDGRMTLDASAFWSDVRDLQLSQMSASGLGRVTVNAGRSRSVGAEIAAKAQCTDRIMLTATYGYTHATFRKYHDYDASNTLVDCRDNRVPFMPDHTFLVDAAYTQPLSNNGSALSLRSITFGANCSGTGRIYWDELNTASQGFYALLGARVSLDFNRCQLNFWGKNLTNRSYNAFYFESAGRGYEQHGRPFQLGVDLKVKL